MKKRIKNTIIICVVMQILFEVILIGMTISIFSIGIQEQTVYEDNMSISLPRFYYKTELEGDYEWAYEGYTAAVLRR